MLPIFDVPNGWIKKSSTKMAQDTPTIVGVVIVASTILRLEGVRNMANTIGVASITLEWHQVQIERA